MQPASLSAEESGYIPVTNGITLIERRAMWLCARRMVAERLQRDFSTHTCGHWHRKQASQNENEPSQGECQGFARTQLRRGEGRMARMTHAPGGIV
jgi:hypothetical protein